MPRRNDVNKPAAPDTNMVCVVPKQNVEILGRALHSLARIGEELYVEPVNNGLTFRTVHANHSVYAEVHFTQQFFSYYKNPNPPSEDCDSDDDSDTLKCRINMKSYIAAFRSLPCLRKQVETCLLQIEPTWLIVKFRCHHNLIRTYRLPVIETEKLQALYTVDEVPNQLVIGADVFAASVKNFQFSERDITLAVEESKAMLRNYVPGGTDPGGVIRSELKLDAGEFISYNIGLETAITFCMRTFRAVLFFSEPAKLPLALKFSSPGNPVVIITNSPAYELRFVLSSLAPEDCDVSRNESQQMLTPLRTIAKQRNSQLNASESCSISEARSEAVSKKTMGPLQTKVGPQQTKGIKKLPAPRAPRAPLEMDVATHRQRTLQTPRGGVGETPGTSAGSQQSTTSSTRAVVGESSGSSPSLQNKIKNILEGLAESFNGESESNSNEKRVTVIPQSDEEEDQEGEEEVDDFVPPSPPPPASKKARLIFRRCFEPTLDARMLDDDEVLAYDSDEEQG